MARWSLLIGAAILVAMSFMVDDASGYGDGALFFGRFHPMLVHLPVGILLLALIGEAVPSAGRFAGLRRAVPVILLVGAWSAIAAATAGVFLSTAGGYDAGTLLWHKRLGLGIAIVATVAYLVRDRSRSESDSARPKAPYLALLFLLLGFIAVAGHLGGDMTHGEGFLTRYMPDTVRGVIGLGPKENIGRLQVDRPNEVTVYATLVEPILNHRCVACHSESNKKGDLALDTPAGIIEGGDDGDVLVAGSADDSEMVRRIWLPLADDDHMPPENRPQVTVAEAELLKWWINSGASFDQTLSDAELTPTAERVLAGYGITEIPRGIFALDVSAPDSTAVARLRAGGLTVRPLSQDGPFLEVQCVRATECLNANQTEGLRALADQVAWLDVSKSQIADSGFGVISHLKHLVRLDLSQTNVSDNDIGGLDGLEYLESLNLYGTPITDGALDQFALLPGLTELYLWQTTVTTAAADRLRQDRPDIDVNMGIATRSQQADRLAE